MMMMMKGQVAVGEGGSDENPRVRVFEGRGGKDDSVCNSFFYFWENEDDSVDFDFSGIFERIF